ncbi:RxLR effector protein PSR2 [Phytophthora ramorum]|uniref:RxLR effector protein PSR2 n=1 Tax=Phytophthora ramorum TaxID=164328 RepID=UPI0030A6D3D0|nr:RxLR effector protein PSR2 [Phytophthora ramorum]
MRLGYVGLFAVALLASTDTASAQQSSEIIHPDSQTLARSLIENHDQLTAIGSLRSYEYDDGEERVNLPSSVIEKAKALVSTATTKKLQTWLKNGKSVDDVFIRLKLTKAGDKLLDNPQFTTWLTYVDDFTAKNPGKTTSAIAKLTTYYGDEAVIKILDAAKKVVETSGVATKLEAAQMQTWLAAGNSADDVFTLLKLNKAGDDILSNPAFASWNTYLKTFNTAHPDQKTSAFAKLTSQYGEVGVSRVVEAALKVKSSSAIAKTVQAEQFERWMAGGKTTDGVFTFLALDKAGDKLLGSPLLNTFTKYMNIYNKRNPDQEITLIGTLTTHYGNVGLSKLLAAGRNVASTSNLATSLDAAQYKLWMSQRKNPDDIFMMLGLEKAGDNLLSSPLFTTFTKFTDAYHAKNLGIKMTTNWIVRAHYTDFDVAKMILAAEKLPSAQSAGKRMEGVLFKDWMQSPDDAFKSLKLDQVEPSMLFESPMFAYWMKFMDDFHKSFPGKNIPRTVLATTYKDEELVKVVEMAQMNPNTKDFANKFETEVLKQFIFAEKQPINVAKLLHVNEKTDANWKLWKKYMQDYNKYHLGGITT